MYLKKVVQLISQFIDQNTEWLCSTESLVSKSKNSPFNGEKMKGTARSVIVDGNLRVENGELIED